jgi:hypothetical protein
VVAFAGIPLAALPAEPTIAEDPVHRGRRTQVGAVVEEGGEHFVDTNVNELVGAQRVDHFLFFFVGEFGWVWDPWFPGRPRRPVGQLASLFLGVMTPCSWGHTERFRSQLGPDLRGPPVDVVD